MLLLMLIKWVWLLKDIYTKGIIMQLGLAWNSHASVYAN